MDVDPGAPVVFDFTRDKDTEVPFILSGGKRLGRIVYEPLADNVPVIGAVYRHLFLEIGDHLGSTSIVIDRATSELVERGTYQAYGATESDYRPDRWQKFREDYRFTGKEEDVEVGLQYFGKRFYAPALQRWVSPDPLELHVGGSGDLNVYAYVSGRALKMTDPLGLCGNGAGGGASQCGGAEGSAGSEVQQTNSAPLEHSAVGSIVSSTVVAAVCVGTALLVCGGATATGDSPLPEDQLQSTGVNQLAAVGPAGHLAGGALNAVAKSAPVQATVKAVAGAPAWLTKYMKGILNVGDDVAEAAGKGMTQGLDEALTAGVPRFELPAPHVLPKGQYIPTDRFGQVIPLEQQVLKHSTQVPLPLAQAEGRAHTVLGGRVGSDGVVYRQSATFPSGTWPKANGQDVPWSRVDWTNHARPWDHTSPHQHPFVYDSARGWLEGARMSFGF